MSEQSSEPDVGLIADEELPEDLQPTEDNPLAQDPDEHAGASGNAGDDATDTKVDGLPDMEEPGSA